MTGLSAEEVDAEGLILHETLKGKHALPTHYPQNIKINVPLTNILTQW
jgi:hypothetical protein